MYYQHQGLSLNRVLAQPLPPAVKALGSVDLPPPVRRFRGRVLLTAEQRVPALEALVTTIQVPPLRVRPADILDLQSYFLRRLSQRSGRRLVVSEDAARQLEGYSFPGNTRVGCALALWWWHWCCLAHCGDHRATIVLSAHFAN